jgi:hypothetical protein
VQPRFSRDCRRHSWGQAPLGDPLKAGHTRAEAGVALAARGVQRRTPVVREGPAAGGTGATDALGCRGAPSCAALFAGMHTADTLRALLLGMAVRLLEGLRCCTEGVEVTQWVRHLGQDLSHGTAEGAANTPCLTITLGIARLHPPSRVAMGSRGCCWRFWMAPMSLL